MMMINVRMIQWEDNSVFGKAKTDLVGSDEGDGVSVKFIQPLDRSPCPQDLQCQILEGLMELQDLRGSIFNATDLH